LAPLYPVKEHIGPLPEFHREIRAADRRSNFAIDLCGA
jgi:hypothetical protein